MIPPEKAPEAYSYEELLEILENDETGGGGEHPAIALIERRIAEYSTLAGETLRQGRGYLPLLTPAADTPAADIIAMECVLAALEEELDSED